MKTLLHLGPAGRQFWTREKDGWRMLADEKDVDREHPIWVVTDLTEETFAEIEIPRLFGRDRADLVERKLAARFPGTHYRSVISLRREEKPKLLDRIAPLHAILFGIDAAERLDAELANIPHLAGICPMSLLLTKLGQNKQLPADLFLVMPEKGALRIVFLKNRTPVLTRLAPTSDLAETRIEEILRTQRYLENLRLLERGGPPPSVLLLGDRGKISASLSIAQLNLIPPPPPWNTAPPADWRLPLFDMALQMPFGQVAPNTRRTRFLAARLRKGAMATAFAILAMSLLVAGSNLLTISDTVRDQEQAETDIKQLTAQSAGLEQRIAGFGVAPDVMRRVIEFNDHELASAPALAAHLGLVAEALHPAGSATAPPQLANLEWRLLNTGEAACAASSPSAASTASATPGGNPAPVANKAGTAKAAADTHAPSNVELSFALTLPGIADARERTLALRGISARLAQIRGAALVQDPVSELVRGTLRGGSVVETGKKYSWCLTLPGDSAAPITAGEGGQP